jgi:hypothetical protein
MKRNRTTKSNIRPVRTMQELRLEKIRLEMEETLLKERIKGDYRQIRDAFTLRNIVSTVTTELSTTSLISRLISAGKGLIGKKKKKKDAKSSRADEQTT